MPGSGRQGESIHVVDWSGHTMVLAAGKIVTGVTGRGLLAKLERLLLEPTLIRLQDESLLAGILPGLLQKAFAFGSHTPAPFAYEVPEFSFVARRRRRPSVTDREITRRRGSLWQRRHPVPRRPSSTLFGARPPAGPRHLPVEIPEGVHADLPAALEPEFDLPETQILTSTTPGLRLALEFTGDVHTRVGTEVSRGTTVHPRRRSALAFQRPPSVLLRAPGLAPAAGIGPSSRSVRRRDRFLPRKLGRPKEQPLAWPAVTVPAGVGLRNLAPGGERPDSPRVGVWPRAEQDFALLRHRPHRVTDHGSAPVGELLQQAPEPIQAWSPAAGTGALEMASAIAGDLIEAGSERLVQARWVAIEAPGTVFVSRVIRKPGAFGRSPRGTADMPRLRRRPLWPGVVERTRTRPFLPVSLPFSRQIHAAASAGGPGAPWSPVAGSPAIHGLFHTAHAVGQRHGEEALLGRYPATYETVLVTTRTARRWPSVSVPALASGARGGPALPVHTEVPVPVLPPVPRVAVPPQARLLHLAGPQELVPTGHAQWFRPLSAPGWSLVAVPEKGELVTPAWSMALEAPYQRMLVSAFRRAVPPPSAGAFEAYGTTRVVPGALRQIVAPQAIAREATSLALELPRLPYPATDLAGEAAEQVLVSPIRRKRFGAEVVHRRQGAPAIAGLRGTGFVPIVAPQAIAREAASLALELPRLPYPAADLAAEAAEQVLVSAIRRKRFGAETPADGPRAFRTPALVGRHVPGRPRGPSVAEGHASARPLERGVEGGQARGRPARRFATSRWQTAFSVETSDLRGRPQELTQGRRPVSPWLGSVADEGMPLTIQRAVEGPRRLMNRVASEASEFIPVSVGPSARRLVFEVARPVRSGAHAVSVSEMGPGMWGQGITREMAGIEGTAGSGSPGRTHAPTPMGIEEFFLGQLTLRGHPGNAVGTRSEMPGITGGGERAPQLVGAMLRASPVQVLAQALMSLPSDDLVHVHLALSQVSAQVASGSRASSTLWAPPQGELLSPTAAPGIGALEGARADAASSVKAEAVVASPPGLPEGSSETFVSVDDAGFVSIGGGLGGAGRVGTPLSSPIVAAVVGRNEGPAYQGSLPLVGPQVVRAVAEHAMLSRREEKPEAAREAGPGRDREEAPARRVDLEALALEMAERILKRIKKEKERRGLYGL